MSSHIHGCGNNPAALDVTQCCFNVGPPSTTLAQHQKTLCQRPVFAGNAYTPLTQEPMNDGPLSEKLAQP